MGKATALFVGQSFGFCPCLLLPESPVPRKGLGRMENKAVYDLTVPFYHASHCTSGTINAFFVSCKKYCLLLYLLLVLVYENFEVFDSCPDLELETFYIKVLWNRTMGQYSTMEFLNSLCSTC